VKTLQVTSPMMRGPDVKRAQTRLHTNPFKQDYMQGGDIDGVYGPETGRACTRAKYWLGYAAKDQQPTYGDALDNFLTGKTKLPKNQVALRASRLKKLSQKPLRQKALERAATDLGMKERPPNTNRCPITARWGVTGPWCAMATSVWYIDAGSKAFRERVDWAYVPYLLAAAVEGGRGIALTTVQRVQPGDIVTFDWEQNGVADHVGLFEKWVTPGQSFQAIEGNTSVGNDSNGGQVMRRERAISTVARIRGQLGLIHVGR
jgi:CHAP domain-containing protein